MADARPCPTAQGDTMTKLSIWMRIVGVFYVLQFVAMAIVRAPIRVQGPVGTLALADAGDPLATFVVDIWRTFGLEVLAIGVAVLVFSRRPSEARGVAWTVLSIELMRGLVNDIYMLVTRGDDIAFYCIWIVIHSTVIVTGLLVLRATSTPPPAAASPEAEGASPAIV
jgi:hypothetical protein